MFEGSVGGALAPPGSATGKEAPGAADHVDDGEGDRQTDGPEDEEEEHEGDDRQGDQEEFHASVVLQREWDRPQRFYRR